MANRRINAPVFLKYSWCDDECSVSRVCVVTRLWSCVFWVFLVTGYCLDYVKTLHI